MVAFPAIEPSYGTDMTEEPRVNRVTFGDGFTQRSNNEVNATEQKWQVVWSGISDAEAEALRVFFRDLKGTGVVDWTPFGQAVQRKFSAGAFRATPRAYNSWDCSVELTEEYDL